MEGMELISFEIISAVGAAKSMYMQALAEAKAGNFEEADQLMAEGSATFLDGHKAHSSLIQKEASGEQLPFSLLLMHAEDQLMSTETLKLVITELIDIHRNK